MKTGRWALLAALCVIPAWVGCNNGDTGRTDTAADFGGTEFVANEQNVGSIELVVTDTNLPIGDITGYSVRVRNADGSPVSNIRVSCDTEAGLAIIEPTRGTEITDSNGQMSGKVGCAAPGSLIIACRLPIGANKRKYVTMKCEGAVPAGFTGFSGAAGGGLATGGVAQPSGGLQGGTEGAGVRITKVEAFDGATTLCSGGSSTTSIDVYRNPLTEAPCTGTTDNEIFTDSAIALGVVNNSNSTVTFTGMTVQLMNASGTAASLTSRQIGFVGVQEIAPNGGQGTLCGLFAEADPPTKRLAGGGTISADTGIRNVVITLTGRNESGTTVTATARTALSFGDFDRCG